jgi:hypothetical protein
VVVLGWCFVWREWVGLVKEVEVPEILLCEKF